MENDPKPFKRSWLQFPEPRKQLLIILPTVALVVVAALVGWFSVRRIQTEAVEVMATQGAFSSEVSQEFLQKTRAFNTALTAVAAAVGLAAVLWVWWLSVWIFGPTRRLERELNEVLYGRMNPESLRVRKSDALYPLVEKMRQALLGRREPPPTDKK